ncbi:hypothetical protein BDV28DRAFT_54004 [Aspergillus coremiiformis]|uniref:F-box domain-containing protein n=1 Tax=Aspergillus coremiiformis TaxID=138285 RepID=A0A5N6YXF4_9EURO|nr:hypothetical protein BDV28DRAFT_54004 [Aspergillus coremiiformis]
MMAQGELWSTLVTAIDPGNIKAMPAVLQSTIDLLETELAKARAALKEIQPDNPPMLLPGDEFAVGAIAAYRQNLITRASDFYYGSHRLSPKEVGLVPVVQEVQSEEEEENDGLQKQPEPFTLMAAPKQASLVDVLSNSLVLDHMAPYLSVSSLLALASTSRTLRSMIMETPYIFRHLDLTQCPGAWFFSNETRGPGGQINSIERVTESLTEDGFHPVPLKGIFAGLERGSILQDVRTLVLDGLPVPAALVRELLLTDRFNVNLLSIRECCHLNERELMQVLQHAVRPSRPKGTPRVKGIYYFTPVSQPRPMVRSRYRDWWSSRCDRPTVNDILITKEEPPPSDESPLYCQNAWYRPSGKLIPRSIEEGWAQTIQKCESIISFDAILCRGPRHNVDLYTSSGHSQDGRRPEGQMLMPAIATVALGPNGCDGCHTSPEGPAIWGQSPNGQFPLLTPLPLHLSSIALAKRPSLFPDAQPILVARCAECLNDRWCYRCNKWFCENCLPSPDRARTNLSPHQTAIRGPRSSRDIGFSHEQRRLGPGVSRDCWECGPTCAACKSECQRTCQNCQGEYCVDHNEGCSPTMCDWCNTSTRHRLRQLY